MPGEVDLRVRELGYRGDVIRQAGIKVARDIHGTARIRQARLLLPGLTEVRLDGVVEALHGEAVLNGRLTAVGDDFGSTLGWLGLADLGGADGWRSLSLKSDLEIGGDAARLDQLELRLDAASVKGAAALEGTTRKALDLDLTIDRVDLDRYRGRLDPKALASQAGEALRHLDAKIDARIERLVWHGLRFEEVALLGRATGGLVAVDSVSLQALGDTMLAFHGEVDLEQERIDLLADVESEHPGRALRGIDLALPVSLVGLQPVGVTGRITGRFDQTAVLATVAYDDGQMTLRGEAGWQGAEPAYDLVLGAAHPDFPGLLEDFGLAPLLPEDDLGGPVQATARLTMDDGGSRLVTGSLELGPTRISGEARGTAEEDGVRWAATATVEEPKGDLLRAGLALIGARELGFLEVRQLAGRWPDLGLDLGLLGTLRGELGFNATGGVAGSGFDFHGKLEDGFLYVDRCHASALGGELALELSLEQRRSRPELALSLGLEAVDAEALAKWLGVAPLLAAELDLSLEGSAAGATLRELIQGFAGEVSLLAGPGASLQGAGAGVLRDLLDGEAEDQAGRQDGVREAASGAPDEDRARRDAALPLPLLELRVDAALHRGIAMIGSSALTAEPAPERTVPATLEGDIDVLIWALDAGIALPDAELRLVGPLADPQQIVTPVDAGAAAER
jgi:hypothetical protein